MQSELGSYPRLSARVGSHYYSYANGYQEEVEVNDPSCLNYMPKPRFDHCASLVDSKWYVLGGVACPLGLIEEYDVPCQRWRQHTATGDVPVASFGIACTAMGGNIYTFGGCINDMKYSNVLSELRINGMVWKTLEPCNSLHLPILKRDAAMTTHGKSLVTFGGYGTFHEHVLRSRASYDKNGKKSEVWTNELINYDLEKSVWCFPAVTGVPPKPCCACRLASVGQEKTVFLGGTGKGDKCVNSLEKVKILDMSAPIWNWITLTAHSGKPTPPPRYGHCVVSLHSKLVLVLWGRGDKMEFLTDGWVMRISDDTKHCHWNEVSFPSRFCKPAFQCSTDLIVSGEASLLVRFGGLVNDKARPCDRMHLIDIVYGDEGMIQFLRSRIPSPTSVTGNDIMEADYPELQFLSPSQSQELTASSEAKEVHMSDIGVSVSIPPEAIPANQSLQFNIRPVASGNIEMPAKCVSHSPLYIILPLQLDKAVKITIEHSCNLESQEDCDRMVFLGVDAVEPRGTYKLKEIEDVVSDFHIGDGKGSIYLKDVQSLRIGRKLPSDASNEDKCNKTWYSALWFRDPCPATLNSIAIFTISQLQPAYIESAKTQILHEHPELEERIVYQPVSFSSEQVKLHASPVDGWKLESNKVIFREEVDLPDVMDIKGLDYPPHITVRATQIPHHHSPEGSSCSVRVLGLNKEITFELVLNSALQQDFSPQFPLSPPLTSSFSDFSTSQGSTPPLSLSHVEPPTSPRHYSLDTVLTIDDVALLHNVLKEAASRWFLIGLELGIPYSDMEIIRLNLSFNLLGPEELFFRMLVKWLQSAKEKRVRNLQAALNQHDFQTLASNLMQELNPKVCEVTVSDGPTALSKECHHDSFGSNPEDLAALEATKQRAKFENDFREAAKELQRCANSWEENELLSIAQGIAEQIEVVPSSLGKLDLIFSVISKIKAGCQELTTHQSLELLVTNNKSETGNQLKGSINEVESLSVQLVSLANSQLRTSVTEAVSMPLLLQNVQNLSCALQSLLRATETASLQRRGSDDNKLLWKSTRIVRTSSLYLRTKELEESGLSKSLTEQRHKPGRV